MQHSVSRKKGSTIFHKPAIGSQTYSVYFDLGYFHMHPSYLYTFKDPQHQNLCTSQRFSSINWADATVHQRLICMTLTDNFSSHFSFYNDTASLKELSLYVLNIQKLRYVVNPKCVYSPFGMGEKKVYKPHAGSCQQ